jgi:adenylate kinase family enzyme
MALPTDTCRIHLTGASGAGVTTLGRALADRLAVPHHDTDDYYWQPTRVPYREKRETGERVRLMREMFLERGAWVLSGSLDSWSGPLEAYFDLVVFVDTPAAVRIARLRDREARRFGAAAIAPGGWRHEEAEAFFAWAAAYDDASREGRSRPRHETWLARLSCPVLRVDGAREVARLAEEVVGRAGCAERQCGAAS